tara:strand:+ start:94 stop:1359 length:1266 start_codon:yes stop_codon:yes gene_type:complete
MAVSSFPPPASGGGGKNDEGGTIVYAANIEPSGSKFGPLEAGIYRVDFYGTGSALIYKQVGGVVTTVTTVSAGISGQITLEEEADVIAFVAASGPLVIRSWPQAIAANVQIPFLIWNEVTVGTAAPWRSLASSPTTFMAAKQNAVSLPVKSDDGITWTETLSRPGSGVVYNMFYWPALNAFIVPPGYVSNGSNFYTSINNGDTWVARSIASGADLFTDSKYAAISSAPYSNGFLIGSQVGNGASTNRYVWARTISDWEGYNFPNTGGFVPAFAGGYYWAMVESGTTYRTSNYQDGSSWTQIFTKSYVPQASASSGQVAIIVGNSTEYIRTTGGPSSTLTLPINDTYEAAIYTDGQFSIIGTTSGNVLQSTDGATWTIFPGAYPKNVSDNFGQIAANNVAVVYNRKGTTTFASRTGKTPSIS